MKRLSLFLIFVMLVLCFYSSPVKAAEAITGFGIGSIMQDGHGGQLAYEINLDFPVVTRTDKGYKICLYAALMYTDRGFQDIEELQAIKTMITYRRDIVGDFFVGTTGGFWIIGDSEKEDRRLECFGINVGYTQWGIEFVLGTEFVPIIGADLWYPHIKVNLLAL